MLWSALKTLVRNVAVFAVFLGADVAGQAVLVWAVPIESASRILWTSSLVLSLLWHVLCGAFLLYAAAEAPRHPPRRLGLREVWVGGSGRLPVLVLTLVASIAVVVACLAILTWAGVAALLALGFVPLAAAAGAPNPLASGLAAIARHALGYAWIVVVGTTVFGLVSAAVALVALYWPTPAAQVVVLSAQGCVVLWLACALGAVYDADGAGAGAAATASGTGAALD